MRGNPQVRFGGRDGRNPARRLPESAPVPTLRSPAPSQEDITIARRLSEAVELLGIALLDHVIIGDAGRWLSLKEKGFL